MQNYNC
ncbi:hypothetical protein B4U79_01296 [Dinothrombium tinctorium]|nr:hypothetical protein B4U79_04495 [Dinothrombium tinctorium]RWS00789.1 hypothetical protein B4U79_12662 [Dinothrombium tinctorium]RWS01053.1 hypothetical protein B4U79_04404 [Dinothrombium tinctorium]RWS02325.1 hypothetical protein B4U79_01296 [Dinothrombium tinctorium]